MKTSYLRKISTVAALSVAQAALVAVPAMAAAQQVLADAALAWNGGNVAAARQLWAQAMEGGDAGAQFNLGILADTPADGTERDPVAARRLYAMAAAQGHVAAAYNLGVMLLEGDIGVSADRQAGLDWLRSAARGGDILAKVRLGRELTADGAPEGEPGAAEGAAWFLRGAEAGHPPAQFAISMLYARGVGVAQDLGEAALWAERAELTQMVTGDVAYCTPQSARLLEGCRRRTPMQ